MKTKLFLLSISILVIFFACQKDKSDAVVNNPPPNDTIPLVDTPVCYSYLDTTDCLDSVEFANVLLGSWTLGNDTIYEKFTFLNEKDDSIPIYYKGIFITNTGNEEHFIWYIVDSCPYPEYTEYGGLRFLLGYGATVYNDKYASKLNYDHVEYCLSDFFSLNKGSYMFKRIK